MPTAVIDAELEAARKARDAARVKRLEAAKRVVEEFLRLSRLDPTVAGMMLDALPRVPVRPGSGSA